MYATYVFLIRMQSYFLGKNEPSRHTRQEKRRLPFVPRGALQTSPRCRFYGIFLTWSTWS